MDISIIVPFRNEELFLPKCIKSLLSQKASTTLEWEILFGNDQSTDNSAQIVQTLIEGCTNMHLYNITEQIGNTKAKANVLAQLIQKSSGKYIIITDADMVFPSSWLNEYAQIIEKQDFDIITGFTTPLPHNVFSGLQYIEWSWAMTWMKTTDLLNAPMTTMGNNMAFKKSSYLKTGGYENLPFSITEDYQLFKEVIIERKGQHYQFFNQKVSAFTYPQPSFKALLTQRKRWLYAALNAHKAIPILVWVLSLTPFLLLLGGILGYTLCFYILVGKTLLDLGASSLAIIKNIQQHKRYGLTLFCLLLFEPYLWCIHLIGLFSFQLNQDFQWKGRQF